MRVLPVFGFMALWSALVAEAVPFWGDKQPLPIETPGESLEAGQFTWSGELAPEGPILVIVSLDEQRAYTYRNGVQIGVATISTGRKGHETPTGVFVTSFKDKNHHSNLYHNAAMPYTQRFTMDGVALHAGGLPGYPSSHGCVHLPSEYARLLFDAAPRGMTVVVADAASSPQSVDHPAFLSPVKTKGDLAGSQLLSNTEAYRWQPELSPTGPLSILASRKDLRILVMRNGIEIGRSKFSSKASEMEWGTHVFTALQPVAGTGEIQWVGLGVAGHSNDENIQLNRQAIQYINIPPEFLGLLRPAIATGTTLMITDEPILESTTGKEVTLLTDKRPGEI